MSSAAPTPPPARGAPAGALAPGFRFHPTDEELVSYYLRRKVAGRPFRVDAIGEVDLYRSEPWDLPGKSRIQSRDMEWYFFSALDKKYSNRSRTNRGTGSGYWKTTGKDRPVCRGGRTIGMKKTLVFHVGRAPKGDRTNWVMHEYRLEDEQLARAGIAQDAFVVCRIFQKRGPGPQNGAQYGAPFVEEDWEEDEPIFFNEEALNGVDNPVTPEIDHYGQIQDMSVQDENNSLLLEPGEQVDFNDCVNPKLYNDQGLSNGPREKIEAPELYNDQNLVGTIGDSDAADQNPSLEVFNDEFLELNDFAYPIDTDSRHGELHPPEMCNDANFVNGEISSEKALHHMNNFFNTDDENVDLPELFPLSQTVENDYYVELGDLLGPEPGHHSSGEPEDDEMQFFDAPSHYPDAGHVLSVDVNNFVDSTIPSSSGPDLVDELIAYFDATENMQSSELGLEDGADTSNQPNTAPIVNEHNVQTYQASPQPSDIDGGKSSLSSVTPNAGEVSRFKSVDIHGQPDARSDDTWDNPFSKRLASMLGSISSPPAFAAEYPMKEAKSIEHYPATRPSSSIHFTAGMIQVHGVSTPGNGKNWSVLKNGDEGFLSYGITRSDETGNLASFEILPKMPGGIMAFVQRNSFHLIFLSVLLLAASFKIWVCIYTN